MLLGMSSDDEALFEEEQSLAATFLKKRARTKESRSQARSSKRRRLDLDPLLQEPREVSIDFIADPSVFFLHSYL